VAPKILEEYSVFCWHSIIQWGFLPQGPSIKEVYQKLYWTGLKKNELSDADPDPINNWFFLHNNSPSCNVAVMKEFPANRMVAILHHPPYLPHLGPADSCFFPNSNLPWKVCIYRQSITEIQDAVTRVLNSIWKEAFLEGIKKKIYKVQVHL
jgi:hypothetical protein